MGKIGKFALKAVVGLLILVIVLVAVAVVYIDHLAKAGIEYGGQKALGVPTSAEKVSIGILSGKAGLDGLKIAQPPGCKSPHFFVLKQGGVEVSLASLRQDVVEVPRLELTGIDMYVEKDKDGKPNYQVILDNQKKLESSPAPAEEKDKGSGKKFVIRELVIRDVTLHAQLVPLCGPAIVKVPEIILKDVGTAGPQGVGMADVVNIVLKATWASVIANGRNILPDDMLQDMDKGLKSLGSLAGSGVHVVGDMGLKMGALTTQTAGGIGNVTTKAAGDMGKGLGEVGKGLGNLLGGDKSKPK